MVLTHAGHKLRLEELLNVLYEHGIPHFLKEPIFKASEDHREVHDSVLLKKVDLLLKKELEQLVFGLGNGKQNAHHFADLLEIDLLLKSLYQQETVGHYFLFINEVALSLNVQFQLAFNHQQSEKQVLGVDLSLNQELNQVLNQKFIFLFFEELLEVIPIVIVLSGQRGQELLIKGSFIPGRYLFHYYCLTLPKNTH